MKKTLSKTRILLLLLAVVFLSSAVYFFLIRKRGQTLPPTPPSTQQTSWKEVVPGISTRQETIEKLGNPKVEGDSLLEFESTSSTRNHTVSLEGNTVSLIKEVVSFRDTATAEDFTAKYGETSELLYGPDAENGYYLFIYSQKGVAYLGNPATGNLLEVWYFPATTFEEFINKWASGYSETLTPQF